MSNYRLLGLALICFSGMAVADNAANTGTVSFTGAIVDTSCQFEVVVQTLETQCYRNGKIFNQRQVITADSAMTSQLPANVGTSKTEWLNKQHSLAIVTISYR
ncbi:hypothetical protein BD65_780 [Yersinia ruckeri]|uniref:type 1 fimbrial protein n=1 Tax=Yersinia ruckeri TaxID=29486 RepID=UPI0005ABDC39|nr:type 1 fimbrial protein [Yersinia ruckeri]AJI94108.1 hypothetical protein BD65_780 [Yersinia ruckeri]MCW6569179.1 type 1 fimbrial protein [Yersinia ruckeri]